MSTSFFIFGFLQAATGYAAVIFYKQEHFEINEESYKSIGSDLSRFVVFFSRMGYVRKKALEEANRTGAAVYEIKSTEMTEGTLGFWWCGRFGMHRWEMPIKPVDVDLSAFDHVTVCSPIWVFAPAAPVKAFCRLARGSVREVDYILLHHTNGIYESAARKLDSLIGLTHTQLRSYRCRTGRLKRVK